MAAKQRGEAPALSATSHSQPTQTSDREDPMITTSDAIASFMASFTSHYATLSDTATPNIFAHLCRKYNTGTSDEQAFYVTAYRLFLSTNSTHLMQGFRAFLPFGWRGVDLGWLEQAIEADVEKEKKKARDSFGELAQRIEGEAGTKKKKRPSNGFRTSDPPHLNKTDTSPRTVAPKRKNDSNEKSPAKRTILSASSITYVSPIYTSKRAILARQNTKPYIHALCGARFGFPLEVQRHHNGQSGRDGCWAKNGKPTGEGSEWNAHESCRLGLSDLEYVKVKEGFVVTDWGDFGDEIRQEGGGDAESDDE